MANHPHSLNHHWKESSLLLIKDYQRKVNEELTENEEVPNNEILKLEIEERKMALRERAVKAWIAEAEDIRHENIIEQITGDQLVNMR